MSKIESVVKYGLAMRKSYDFSKINKSSWYAKHMYSGMIKMQARLKAVDCFIEVRDSRVPFSSTNPDFYSRLTAVRPLVVVFSKVDLADWKDREKLIHFCDQQPEINRVVFANLKKNSSTGVKNLIPAITEAIQDNEKFNSVIGREINAMVIGIPNVGKSSLINAVRTKVLGRSKGTLAGAKPGVTRSVLEKIKVCSRPLIYIQDTPGIIPPSINSIEAVLKLSATACLADEIIDSKQVADYILFRLNEVGNHEYVNALQLASPSDDIDEILFYLAEKNDDYIKRRIGYDMVTMLDVDKQVVKFLKMFRQGNFGKVMFDDLSTLR